MMDPYIDGVVPIPMSQDEQDFLSGNLRRIHAAYDDAGFDLSALPEKAADEIERLRKTEAELRDVLTSARAIAERNGDGTHWGRFSARIGELGIGSVTARTFRILPSDAV